MNVVYQKLALTIWYVALAFILEFGQIQKKFMNNSNKMEISVFHLWHQWSSLCGYKPVGSLKFISCSIPRGRIDDSEYIMKHSVTFLGVLQNFDRWLFPSSCLSVRLAVHPHGTTRLPLNGFPCNLTFEYFSKICWENASFIKVRQE